MATILVVDDRKVNRELIGTILGYKGHEVLEAGDGAEALALIETIRPDLVISDILMPTMDGYEFVRRLRSDTATAGIPVIFSTAHFLDREAKALAENCGVKQIIYKPAGPETVLAEVDAAFGLCAQPIENVEVKEFDREHLRLLSNKLTQQSEDLLRVQQRLEALVELGQQLTAKRDPLQLLEFFCHSARKIVGAKYAAVGVLDQERTALLHFFTSGMNPEAAAHIRAQPVGRGILSFLLSGGGRVRVRDIAEHPSSEGFPEHHPRMVSFLGAAIRSSQGVYGALYLTDKIGFDEFSEEDEKLIATLVAQVGIAFENARFFEEIQRHSAELEARVDERTAELRSANRELESFSYSVSHDLRAPLRHIHGFADLLQKHAASSLDETSRRYTKTITEAAQQMGSLVDDLLAFFRMGRVEMRKSLVSLERLAKEVIKELERYTDRKNIAWELGDLPEVEGDPAMLRLVLMNLLSNAVKYTGKQDRSRIEIGSSNGKPGDRVFFVRDNGVGFDMKYVDKLFGVFQRLHRADEFEGTGIGLANVQRIIHRHGGKTWAEGVVDGGATFYFTLPQANGSRDDEVKG